jgi:FAD/FMN-containing dehydrogenase
VPQVALDLVLRHVPGTRAPLEGRHTWNVLIEVTAPAGAADPVDMLSSALGRAIEDGQIEDATIAASEAQAENLWKLRESISEAERVDGMAAKHDISVAVSQMPAFLDDGRGIVEARFPGVRVIAFGHLGDGNVHFNVRAPEGADDRAWFAREGASISSFVHEMVTAEGGSLSAEHGIGQTKLADFARTATPARLAALRAIKLALDPHLIMNPGKLVPMAHAVAPNDASQ